MVLEGGAMRGMYTAGAIDVLMENDISFDGYIGVSAGASFGCNFKSRQKGRAIRYNLRYMKDPRYSGIRSLLRTGDIFGSEFCYHEIPERLDPFDGEEFYRNPVRFYAVATEAETGKSVYHECKGPLEVDVEWMRASSSMPVVSRPVSIDGKLYFDGGVSDSIPVEYFMKLGYGRNVVILTRPRGYRKEEKPLPAFMKFALRKYPELIKAMAGRSHEYNRVLDLLDKLEKEGKVLVIAPTRDLGVKRIEKDEGKVRAIYGLGRQDTLSRLEEIRDFLS